MPNPTYCIILNFSPTMKYAKIGTDTFPRENNATVIDVSTLRKSNIIRNLIKYIYRPNDENDR